MAETATETMSTIRYVPQLKESQRQESIIYCRSSLVKISALVILIDDDNSACGFISISVIRC